MHRVILLVLCVGGCTWIGLSYAGSLRQRAQRLKLARDGISQLVSAVRYTNQPLCAVSESIAARVVEKSSPTTLTVTLFPSSNT